jgi:hypothetical protein
MTAARLSSSSSSLLLTLLAAVALTSCDRRDDTPPPPGAKAGRLVGKLADPHGQPLSDVTITIDGFSDQGEPVTRSLFVRGPATRYEMTLPDGKYSTPTARVAVDYNERRYFLPLGSADESTEWPQQMDSKRGLVRDFTWRIRGKVPGGNAVEPSGYWGATILFDKQGDLGDSVHLKVTLAPDGPLIDGSPGEPIEFDRVVPWRRNDEHYLFDVPIGRYVATVKQVFGEQQTPLRVSSFSVDPAHPDFSSMSRPMSSAVVEFECVEGKPGEYKVLSPNLTAYPPR